MDKPTDAPADRTPADQTPADQTPADQTPDQKSADMKAPDEMAEAGTAADTSAPAKAATGKTGQNDKSPSAFRTISEVARELGLPQHVLRFWETKFAQVRPLKRGGGRRYYRPEDVDLLQKIQFLLYEQGYTIKGVQKLLKSKDAFAAALVTADDPSLVTSIVNEVIGDDSARPAKRVMAAGEVREALRQSLEELKALRAQLTPAPTAPAKPLVEPLDLDALVISAAE